MVEGSHEISRRDFLGQLAIMAVSFAAASWPEPALANVPTVALRAIGLDGNQFEVTINVFHKGNNVFHYVDKVVLFADGKEIESWGYSWRRRPEAENFSVRTKVPVTKETVFSAMANCNRHGENEDRGRLVLSPKLAPK